MPLGPHSIPGVLHSPQMPSHCSDDQHNSLWYRGAWAYCVPKMNVPFLTQHQCLTCSLGLAVVALVVDIGSTLYDANAQRRRKKSYGQIHVFEESPARIEQ